MIENDNIRDQKSFDKWVKSNLNQQGGDNSDRIDAQIRSTNENNDRLDLQASERKSERGLYYQNSQGNLGTGFVKVMEKKSSEVSLPDMTTLREGFVLYCRLLGLRQSTCKALLLLLNSKELLIAIMKFMAEIDASHLQEDMNQDDITTLIVQVAKELREEADKMTS